MAIENMISQKKAEKLISLGYCERIYTDSTFPSEEYKFMDREKGKRYKLVPLPVTDVQWEKILSIGVVPNTNEGVLPKFLKWLGIITFIAAFIAGIIVGIATGFYSFNVSSMFICWGAGFAAGIFTIWMGEVLRSLRKMQNQ